MVFAIMSDSGVEKLSVELHLRILKQLSTLQDVYTLIQASPQHYRVFLTFKEEILSSAIQRMLGPEVSVDAIAAVEASSQHLEHADRKNVRAFLRRYQEARNMKQPRKKLSLSTALWLCRLHHAIDYHIEDYTQRATAVFEQCAKSMSSVKHERHPSVSGTHFWESGPLSAVEKERLRRAFYRVELFEKLFGDQDNYASETKFSAKEQAECLLTHYSSSEIEEIACMRDYLRLRMEETYERVDDTFIEKVIATYPVSSGNKRKREIGRPVEEGKVAAGGSMPDGKKRKREPQKAAEEVPARDFLLNEKKRKRNTEEALDKEDTIAPGSALIRKKRKWKIEEVIRAESAIGQAPVRNEMKRKWGTKEMVVEEEVDLNEEDQDGCTYAKDEGKSWYCFPGHNRFGFAGVDYDFSQDEKRWQRSRMDNGISLGLPFLRRLFTQSGEKQTRLLMANRRHGLEFLGEALKARRRLNFDVVPATATQTSDTKHPETEEKLGNQNKAWQWAWGDVPEGCCYWCKSKGLRTWGYVFWDNNRLSASGITNQR